MNIDGVRLAAAVCSSGMTEVEICARAGVAHVTYKKMLQGQMVRFNSVGRLCKVLGLNPAEIIREAPHEDFQARQ